MVPKVLYHMESSPPSRAVLMIIDILGIEVQIKNVHIITNILNTSEFIQKNPMKSIPLYEEGDYWLADSHAIIIYLMETYGREEHSQLFPFEKRKRATVIQRLFFECGIIFPSYQAVAAEIITGRLGELTRNMVNRIERAYNMLQVYLTQSLYVADDVMTIADLSIFSTISLLNGICPVDENRFPELKQWLENMNQQDVCQRINKPSNDKHVSVLKALMVSTQQQRIQSKL